MAFVVTTLLSAAACGSSASTLATGGSSAPGITSSSVRLGTTTPMTGSVSATCLPINQGIQAWFDSVNAKGGVNGRKIHDDVLDDAYQAPRAVGNVRTLLAEPVFAVLGGCGSAPAVAIYQQLQDQKVPYLFPFAGVTELVQPVHSYVYALIPLYGQQVVGLVKFAAQKYGSGSVGVLATKLPGYQDDINTARQTAGTAGLRWTNSWVANTGTPDYTSYVVQIKQANPDYLLLYMGAEDALRTINAMSSQGWLPTKRILAISPIATAAFASAADATASARMSILSPTVAPASSQAKECIAAFQKYAPGLTPDGGSLYGCASAQLFTSALDKAGANPTRDSFIHALDTLKNFNASAALPPITFSPPDHVGQHSMFVLNVQGKQLVDAGMVALS